MVRRVRCVRHEVSLLYAREELKQEIESVKAVRVKTETELRRVLAEKEEVVKEKEEVVKKNTEMLVQLKEDKEHLQTQVLAAEEVCGEFKEEVVLTMESYNKIAKDLDDERAKCLEYRTKRDRVMNELSKRTEETLKQAGAIKTLKAELIKKDETSQVLLIQVLRVLGVGLGPGLKDGVFFLGGTVCRGFCD